MSAMSKALDTIHDIIHDYCNGDKELIGQLLILKQRVETAWDIQLSALKAERDEARRLAERMRSCLMQYGLLKGDVPQLPWEK